MPSVNVQPDKVLNLRSVATQGIYSAIYRVAADFLAGENKPWYYYTGVLAGASIAATGIDGASAAVTVLANQVEALLLKNPNGGELAVFVDGVQQGVIDLYAANETWELIEIFVDPVAAAFKTIELRNNIAGAAAYSWLALGTFTITRDILDPVVLDKETLSMPYDTIVFRVQDDESDTREASVPINIPTGSTVAEIQAFADAIAPEIDALTEGKVASASVTINLTLPGGLKADPVAGSFNERGGLITFDTTGPRADSVRIPAMNKTIMPGDSFALTDTDVAALVTRLTTATTAANIRPRTTQDYEYSAARRGSKSLRK